MVAARSVEPHLDGPAHRVPALPGVFGQSTGFPRVLDALRARGFSESDLAKVAGANWDRLFRANWG